jgi:ribA/ribD-fused uncharacterized protein
MDIEVYNDDKWMEVADKIVYTANYAKFSQTPSLKTKLLETNNKIIVEAAAYDARWGNGLSLEETINTPMEEWKGENRLGKALMKVRETLRDEID